MNAMYKNIRYDSHFAGGASLRPVDKPFYLHVRFTLRPWDARMESLARSRPTADHGNGFVGVIYGDIGPTTFRCSVVEPVERYEFVQVRHETCGTVLGRVDEIERKTDLSLERAHQMGDGEPVDIEDRVSVQVTVIGYRDDRGLLQVPRTPFRAGEAVHRAEKDVIKEVIGLAEDKKHGAYVGLLSGHDVPVYLDINAMVQKHVSIIAKTGGGKSYVAGDIIEELMKHHVTTVILDPHGEYVSLAEKGKVPPGAERFHIEPRSYPEVLQVFSPDTKVNHGARPLKFTLSNLDARDILSLTGSGKVRTHLTALRKALDLLRQASKNYTIRDIIRVLERDEDPANASLMDELEYLSEVEIFAQEGTRIDELVVKGKTTIVNLKGVAPDIQELVVNRLATAMFELRKVGRIPPMMLVVEEAHNFCPQVGQVASSKVFRTLASEGRKFGLGLIIITQRAAKVDKNVLSQCNTQIILKVTNPNDLKAIVQSVEGLTTAMAEEISRLPIGVAIMTGGGLQMPLMVEVRPRETKHGGESVKIIED
jgi:DNA helicase HerA-like ATPase